MFLWVNKLTHFNGALLKSNNCEERIEGKVGVYICLLSKNYYNRLMVSSR